MIKLVPITSYNTFKDNLKRVGFTLAGENQGLFSLADSFQENIQYHTDDGDTDPWVWRMACLEENDGTAYGKLFFNKGGYITREWYPFFYRVRRNGATLNETYQAGNISHMARRIYDVIVDTSDISLAEIKSAIHASMEDKSKINTAITQLQMGMFITISGESYKISKDGQPYGWPVTTFTTCEAFAGEEVMQRALQLDYQGAFNRIAHRIKEMNPHAADGRIRKFIAG